MRGCRLGESLPSSVGPFDCPVSATPEALTAPFSHLVQRVPSRASPIPQRALGRPTEWWGYWSGGEQCSRALHRARTKASGPEQTCGSRGSLKGRAPSQL